MKRLVYLLLLLLAGQAHAEAFSPASTAPA